MKATGIVRRIDDLGRVVIPKEIRRTMRIREGDPLEIYTTPEGEVIFKKYSPIGEIQSCASQYADVLSKMCGLPALICDCDHVVAAAGLPKKDVLERRITPPLEQAMEARKCLSGQEAAALQPVEGVDKTALAVCPVVSSGDVAGCVLLLAPSPDTAAGEVQTKLAQAAAAFLGRQLEE